MRGTNERRNEAARRCGRALAILVILPQTHTLVAMQNSPTPPPVSATAQKARDQISALPIGGRLTVRKTDGTEYHGNLHSIEAQTFSIREVDLKQTITIAYGEVDRVRKNYGGKGFGGRRVDPKRSLIVGAILVGALLTLVFVAVAHDK